MNISCTPVNSRSLIFLAPAGAQVRKPLHRWVHSSSRHESLTIGMQRLRGRVYLKDGAISSDALSHDGRHVLPTDENCWHLLTVARSGEVLGCTRFLQHNHGACFDDLRISESSLASSELWGGRLRAAVEQNLRDAAGARFSFVEVGGWAMAEQIRCTAEGLRSVLAVFAWSRLAGGALGISTATERNGSASILRRLGGNPITWDDSEIPAYYDPQYGCLMHALRYDSRRPAARYEASIAGFEKALANVPVISPERPAWHPLFRGFAAAAAVSSINADLAHVAAARVAA